ncbi:MAG: nucleotidyltransferase domain-containing protein, partial [Limisphaerales bacterium]
HGLPADTVTKIREVLSRFPEVEKAVLYGSRAKGNAKPGSDIDLTLLGSRLNQRIVGQIDDTLDDLLLPYRFDLSIFARIKDAELLEHIARVGVTFYERTAVEAEH